MKSTRRLSLSAERLAELSAADLGGVAAGAPPTGDCPDHTWYCITGGSMCGRTRLLCV